MAPGLFSTVSLSADPPDPLHGLALLVLPLFPGGAGDRQSLGQQALQCLPGPPTKFRPFTLHTSAMMEQGAHSLAQGTISEAGGATLPLPWG